MESCPNYKLSLLIEWAEKVICLEDRFHLETQFSQSKSFRRQLNYSQSSTRPLPSQRCFPLTPNRSCNLSFGNGSFINFKKFLSWKINISFSSKRRIWFQILLILMIVKNASDKINIVIVVRSNTISNSILFLILFYF